jgi:hypothetical protein
MFSNFSREVRPFWDYGDIIEDIKSERDYDVSGCEAGLCGDSAKGIFTVFCIGSHDVNDDLKAALSHSSETYRRMNRKAAITSFSVTRHMLKAYAARYLRSVTEGGKNATGLSSDIADWRKVLSRILPS